LENFFCGPFRLFGVLCGKKPLKQLTAKSAKDAKISQRVEVRTLSSFLISFLLFISEGLSISNIPLSDPRSFALIRG